MLEIGVAATLISATLASTPAQLVCAERQSLLESLARQYREAPTAVGVANNGSLIELLRTVDGKTWTLLMTRPDGTSCVVAAGEAWEDTPQVAGGQPL
ncbi:MAG: hypothetical protein ACM31L_14720 [Actinomycetota bacterium]